MIANPSFFFGVRQISNGRLESAALTFPDRKNASLTKEILELYGRNQIHTT